MPIYKIPNIDLAITDPIIEIISTEQDPNITNVKVVSLQYSIQIELVVYKEDGSDLIRYGMILDQVQAQSLDWEQEGALMMNQIITRLSDFDIST